MASMLAGRVALWVSLTFVYLVGALPAYAQSSQADDEMSEARALFLAGRAAFEEQRYETALGYFEKAYQQSGRPALLYNIARCRDRLDQPAQALRAFEQYLTAEPNPPNRELVESRVVTLRALVAEQRAQAASAPAAVPAPAPVIAVHTTDAGPAHNERSWLPPVLTLGAGGLVMITGGVVMAVGKARGDDVESGEAGTRYSALQSEADSAERLWVSGQVMIGIGAAAAVGGLTWLLLDRRERQQTVRAAITPQSIVLTGSF